MLRARDNPFATDRVLRERYRLDDAGWDGLMERWRALRFRGAIVGPHGAGKTTLLEDLAARLEREGWRSHWVRLSEEFPRLPAGRGGSFFRNVGAKDVVMLDGAEQLGVLSWRLFRWRARRAGGLLITTHRAGRLPTLHRCATTPALLRDLVTALGENIDDAEAARLHARHGGNLREALRELYDRHGAEAGHGG